MKNMTFLEKIMVVVLSTIMVIAVLPITAIAQGSANGVNYDLWIGGVQVTDANKGDITKAINNAAPNTASGTATFDSTTNTLVLNGFSYEGAGYAFEYLGRDSAAAVYSKLDTLQITAMDASKISHNQGNFQSYGLYTSGNLVITEESIGTLLVMGGATDTRSLGIFVGGEDFIVNGGRIIGEGSNAGTGGLSTGIWCIDGNINVNNKGELIGSGGNADISRGVCAFGKIIINGGTVIGNGGEGRTISHGISMGALESNREESQLIGTAASADESIGVLMWNDSVFSKGTMKGFAGEGQSNQNCGILFKNTFTIGGGTVVGKGTNGAYNKAPAIDSEFTKAGIWYGEAEDIADADGPKSIGEIETQYTQNYVRVSIADIGTENSAGTSGISGVEPPKTGDYSSLWLWATLTFVSGGMLLERTLSERKRESQRKDK